jgi:hypothetical protein
MNKTEAQAILDSAYAAADVIVAAQPDLTYAQSEALHDKVFFGLLSEAVGEMKLIELLELISL